MKTLLLLIASAIALAGCTVVPAYGPPGGYVVAPAPLIIAPSFGYGHRGHHGPRHRH